ncbi:Ankyrin repeat protein [Giardia duodenalis assemblage B]|uniref:Ankyrin repeat protein n=1 Tax=Giardia duodenalis assemblage B TaxID=1394984 RepID=A0A132NY42_GIAIN|nr:Ankyrin repeat protein [Giardia intestinalis assemblage B]
MNQKIMVPRPALKREWFDAIYRGDMESVSQMLPQMRKTCNQWGETGLMISAKNGDVAMAELLAPHEAGITNVEGRTALMLAAAANSSEICKLLVAEEKHIVTLDSRNALMFAASTNAVDAAETLVCDLGKTRDALGRSPLHYAVLNQAPHVVQLILQYPNDVSHDDIALLLDYSKERGYDVIAQMLAEYDPTNRIMEFDQVSLIKLSELQQLMQKFPSSSLRSEATKLLSEAIESVTIDLEKKSNMVEGYNNEINMLHERISVLNETIGHQQKELDGLYKTVKLGISGVEASKQNITLVRVCNQAAQELMIKPLSVDTSKTSHDERYSNRCSTDMHDAQHHDGSDVAPTTEAGSLETYLAHTKSTPSRADTTEDRTILSDRDQQAMVVDPTIEAEESGELDRRAPVISYSPHVSNDEERQYLAYMALMAEIDEEHGVTSRTLERPPPHLTIPRTRESIGTDEVDAIVSTGSLVTDLKGSPVSAPAENPVTTVKEDEDNDASNLPPADMQIEFLEPQQPRELVLLESDISKREALDSALTDQIAENNNDYIGELGEPLEVDRMSSCPSSSPPSEYVDSPATVVMLASDEETVRSQNLQLVTQSDALSEPPADEGEADALGEPPADEGEADALGEPPADEGEADALGEPPADEGEADALGEPLPHEDLASDISKEEGDS